MPKADVKPLETGPGFGCSCRAWRPGEPADPNRALAAMARSANVTVSFIKRLDGTLYFRVWTEPDITYTVTHDPNSPGGWCKHTIACLSHWAPWHRQLALGADDALAEIKRLEKESKKLRREITKWQKKCTG